MTEFQAWPKIPRLNRNCIATEKIDGTNAAVVIEKVGRGWPKHEFELARIDLEGDDPSELAVFAQARKRLLNTNEAGGKGSDNFAFAAWVKENALDLAAVLGEGRHFGEWWGAGIQRAYGLTEGERHFSLFNSGRWHDQQANGCGESVAPDCCSVVPVLAQGTNINAVAEEAIGMLAASGSFAAPGFDNPEGVVVFHTAARRNYKVTIEGDEAAKGTFKGMHAQPTAEAAS
jgi:hypothetical protein